MEARAAVEAVLVTAVVVAALAEAVEVSALAVVVVLEVCFSFNHRATMVPDSAIY